MSATTANLPALPSSLTPEGNLSRYLQEIRKFPLLEPQQEFMLAKAWREHGDSKAAHQLVTSHLRLVAKIAMGYRGYGLPVAELISEGNVGMMQAVKRFDPDRGFRLATYAMWWIRASIQEYILHSWSLVKMGTTAAQKKLFFNLRKLKGQMQAIEEGDLSPEQVTKIATRLGVPEEEVVNMNRRLAAPDSSLNAPVKAEGDMEWQDWLVDDSPNQEARLAESQELGQRKTMLASGAEAAHRSRAAHHRRAPPGRRAQDAGRPVVQVRHQPRARAPDRGARLRQAAEGHEEHGGRGGQPPGQAADGGGDLIVAPATDEEAAVTGGFFFEARLRKPSRLLVLLQGLCLLSAGSGFQRMKQEENSLDAHRATWCWRDSYQGRPRASCALVIELQHREQP